MLFKDKKVQIVEQILKLRDKYSTQRHSEHMEFVNKTEQLVNLRFDLACKLVNLKDIVAKKRFEEKIKLIELQFGKELKSIEKQVEKIEGSTK